MAGDVVNIKVCSPLKLRSGLTGKKPAICHYSYNLPLWATISVGQMTDFQSLTADVFHAGRKLFSEDFSSSDNLSFRRNTKLGRQFFGS